MKRKIYKFTRVLLILALVASICVSAAGMVSIVNGATDSYTNNGETIKVYQTCQIDLSKEKHTEKVAKIFIGWQKANGNWANTNASYSANDVLTAMYIDFTDADFAINNNYLTEDGGLKLNLGFTDTETMAKIPNVMEKGIVWVDTDTSRGREIRLDQPIVKRWSWDTTNKVAFRPLTDLGLPNKKTNSNSVAIPISEDDYNAYYTARGYIKYKDHNGVERIAYSYEESVSAYKVAMEADDTKAIYDTIIKKVEADNDDYCSGIKETVMNVYDKANTSYKRNTDSYDVFSKIEGTGQFIQHKRNTVLLNTGVKENITLGWLTDLHCFNVGYTDVDREVTNILSTYRGSSWLWERPVLDRVYTQIEYATSRYNKTIITGDIVDNFAFGTLSAVKAIVSDKSVNGNILMNLGNHEFDEETNGDVSGRPDKYTLKEKYEIFKPYWANEPQYYAEILKTSDGYDNAMVILLDNANKFYPAGTAEKLTESLNLARLKNIPVLIFQHRPTSTYNYTEAKVYYGPSKNFYGFGTEDDHKSWNNYRDYGGKDATVVEVDTIIRKNHDIIKGVFAGHTHNNTYTEIVALDELGRPVSGKYIPQFVAATAENKSYWVNEIVLTVNCENHVYDSCDDIRCNVCDGYRMALEHKYTEYVNNNDATCIQNATETRKCEICGLVQTRESVNSKLPHKYNSKGYCTVCNIYNVEKPTLLKEDGKWYYYENGVKSNKTTLVKYEGKWFYLENGIWDAKITNTLVKCEGNWFYIKGGKWNSKMAEGLYKYNGVYFWIQNGKWNSSMKDGLHKYSGKWFYIKDGKWASTKKGLIKHEGKDFYISGGKWDSKKTTLYKKSGEYYAIKSGKWYKGMGIIKYNGKKYYVRSGYAHTSFSGSVIIGGKRYTVKKGIIK